MHHHHQHPHHTHECLPPTVNCKVIKVLSGRVGSGVYRKVVDVLENGVVHNIVHIVHVLECLVMRLAIPLSHFGRGAVQVLPNDVKRS